MQKPSDKKKSNLSPAAAKILEQYRNAGKTPTGENGAPISEDQNIAPRAATPGGAAQMRRSGTRGK